MTTDAYTDILLIFHGSSGDATSALYRRLAAERHPDRGGSTEKMAELNAARDAAMKELGA